MDEYINLDFGLTPIGFAIKKAREAKNITREQLVESLDISTRHLQSHTNFSKLTQPIRKNSFRPGAKRLARQKEQK